MRLLSLLLLFTINSHAGTGEFFVKDNTGTVLGTFTQSSVTVPTALKVSSHSAFGQANLNSFSTINSVVLNAGEVITNFNQTKIGVGSIMVLNPSTTPAQDIGGVGVYSISTVEVGNSNDFSSTTIAGIITEGGYEGNRQNNQNLGVVGISAEGKNKGPGRVNTAIGVIGEVFNEDSSGTLDEGAGAVGAVVISAGSVSTATALAALTPENSGTITTNYGLWIQDQSGVAGITDSFNIRSFGSGSKNVFDGKVGISTSAPSSPLSVVGNSILDGETRISGPLYLSSGTAVRNFLLGTFTFDSANVPASSVLNQTVSISNINTGDKCFMNSPSLEDGISVSISSAGFNTFQLRYVNPNVITAVNPASQTYHYFCVRP